jgi:hypothetical protein
MTTTCPAEFPPLVFAASYGYSPHGSGRTSERSRLLRMFLKEGNPHFMQRYAMRVRQQVLRGSLPAEFFTQSDVLVPVPGSSSNPIRSIRVTLQLAEALRQEGLGGWIWSGLRRATAVPKSATASRRPSVQRHFASFECGHIPACNGMGIVLIDDVVTRGRTLLAAAARLREAAPTAQIRAFALLRTVGSGRLDRMLDPCRGVIEWRRGDARRSP